MDTAPNTKDESIRVSSITRNKIKNGEEEGYKKINRETKKYEASIIVAGGASFYGLSDLILLEGTMRDFSYVQALKFYKENYEEFKQHSPTPNIAYPIETLWAELKQRVKSRNLKNPEELKIITIDEWNKIPIDYIKKLFINFRKR